MTLNLPQIVTSYEDYINNTLKEDLKELDLKLQQINGNITEFVQIKKSLEMFKNDTFADGYKTQIDIGNNFFMEAKVPDTSKMLFNVGLGIYIEYNQDEALKYTNARIDALERQAEMIRSKSAQVKAHIKLMLIGIGELQNISG